LTDDMLRTFRENDVLRAKCKLGTRSKQKYPRIFPVLPSANVYTSGKNWIPKEA